MKKKSNTSEVKAHILKLSTTNAPNCVLTKTENEKKDIQIRISKDFATFELQMSFTLCGEHTLTARSRVMIAKLNGDIKLELPRKTTASLQSTSIFHDEILKDNQSIK